jgi:GntR family transcriptional regulator
LSSGRNCRANVVRFLYVYLSYSECMSRAKPSAAQRLAGNVLDRTSFVPLYYQLQEVLKEQIESGVWQPGDAIPSEPELAQRFGVSRVVVRQALAILSDDRQIVRVQGRGTFVAEPKLDTRAGGLSRLLMSPRSPEVAIEVLDVRASAVERSIRERLCVDEGEPILRLTTLLSLRGVPLAITYSFFRSEEVSWLERAAKPGGRLPRDLVLAEHGIELAQSRLSIETSQCGQFEADRFGIQHRAAVFLVLSTEFRSRADADPRPFEIARVEYRGDLLQFELELSSARTEEMSATWTFTDEAKSRLSGRDAQ